MTELITILVIVGILAAVAIPRYFDRNTFDERGFYDQAISTLRYAQKAAIAQHRFVCVAITGGNTVTLTQGAANTCGAALANPAGAPSYSIAAPQDVTISDKSFYFDALGKPDAAQSITVGSHSITVEQETGYVH